MAESNHSDANLFDDWLGEDIPPSEPFEQAQFPILPLRDTVLYPHMVAPLFVGRTPSVRAIHAAMETNQRVVVVAQKDGDLEEPTFDDLYNVGTEVVIGRMLRMPDGTTSIWVQGQRRVRITERVQEEPYFTATVAPIEETGEDSVTTEALMRAVLALFEKVVQYSRTLPDDAYIAAMNADEPGWLADLIASILEIEISERQELLEIADCDKRLQRISVLLGEELDVLELENQIHDQVQQEVDRSQREYFLREQMRIIQSELGENDPHLQDVDQLRERIDGSKMPDEVRERAEKELSRLAAMPSAAPEVSVIRTYVEWLIELPWEEATVDQLDIAKAAKLLDASHYGLPKAKERILEHLAVRQLAGDKMKSPILCFVGPPGTGKTSLGRSIAEALGRRFVRVSLGGIRDEAEIRGHRRTYVGALPGRIIQTMRRAGTKNPVFMLDEVDKLGLDFRGDPASALLEVLDPEQNYAFSDHYLEVPFDLSKVLFITTANLLSPIPEALEDRMEVIHFPGYMEEEKLQIARQFLIPHQLEQNGLERLQFSDGALTMLIREYTEEAGVRNLDREIANICRKVARRVAEHKTAPQRITRRAITRHLGPPRFSRGLLSDIDQIGVATGVAWTEAGGDTLLIEVSILPGKGSVQLTGQLGDVMQESAQTALSYVRTLAEPYGFDDLDFDKVDIHLHVPEGAVPKDGPSAGVTISVALLSALTDRPIRHDVAMTGEVTLRGHILPIGGVREKALAARRAGLTTMILPEDNRADTSEVPAALRRGIKFIFVKHMDQVLPIVLGEAADQGIDDTQGDATPETAS